jgi:hypothetical protein
MASCAWDAGAGANSNSIGASLPRRDAGKDRLRLAPVSNRKELSDRLVDHGLPCEARSTVWTRRRTDASGKSSITVLRPRGAKLVKGQQSRRCFGHERWRLAGSPRRQSKEGAEQVATASAWVTALWKVRQAAVDDCKKVGWGILHTGVHCPGGALCKHDKQARKQTAPSVAYPASRPLLGDWPIPIYVTHRHCPAGLVAAGDHYLAATSAHGPSKSIGIARPLTGWSLGCSTWLRVAATLSASI